MKRAYAKRHDSHKPAPTQPAVPIGASGRVIQLSLDRDALLGLMQDSLESLALKLGMLVASSLLEDEVTRLCGPRSERQPHRTHTRYGHQRGTATLAGRKIPIARPRVRRTDGGGEVPLGAAEPVQVLLGQIDSASFCILAQVAQDVGELEGTPERICDLVRSR